MGRLGSGGWSGVGGNGIGFGGVLVRGLGSGRSKELGVWGRRSLSRVEIKEVGGVGVRGWVREVGVGGGYGRLGLEAGVRSWVGVGGIGGWVREVGVVGVGVGGQGLEWDRGCWGWGDWGWGS